LSKRRKRRSEMKTYYIRAIIAYKGETLGRVWFKVKAASETEAIAQLHDYYVQAEHCDVVSIEEQT
jgi:hypothetical protein